MQKGVSFASNSVLKYIGEEHLEEIEVFIENCLKENYKSFTSKEEANNLLRETLGEYLSKLSLEEMETLRTYTGYNFRCINAVLRNNWNYDVNGLLTEEKKREYYNLAEDIRKVINKANPIPFNIKTYRGVNIAAFNSYNITKLEELMYLKDKYVYEDGFTSTSILKDSSFFYNESVWGPKSNIEIEYLIPEYSDDGVLLLDGSISYSPNQFEYLINSGSLFKVLDVEIKGDKALIKMVLIPEKLWNLKDYEMERGNTR